MDDVKTTAKLPRIATTLALRELMERKERLEMAARIRELREASPYKQHHMAAKLPGQGPGEPMTTRNYQKIEKAGTTKWELVEEIAKIHDVDPWWIWQGEERKPTPEPFASPQLDRIQAGVERTLEMQLEILERFDALGAVQEADAAARSSAPSRKRSSQRRASKASAGKAARQAAS